MNDEGWTEGVGPLGALVLKAQMGVLVVHKKMSYKFFPLPLQTAACSTPALGSADAQHDAESIAKHGRSRAGECGRKFVYIGSETALNHGDLDRQQTPRC
jgi:hypothetical protein